MVVVLKYCIRRGGGPHQKHTILGLLHPSKLSTLSSHSVHVLRCVLVPRPAESAGDKAVDLIHSHSALNFHNAREPFIYVSKRWDRY